MNQSIYSEACIKEYDSLPEDSERKIQSRKFFNSNFFKKYNLQYMKLMELHKKRKMKL